MIKRSQPLVEEQQGLLDRQLVLDNLYRVRFYASIVIVLECLMLVVQMTTKGFVLNPYLICYVAFMLASIFFLVSAKAMQRRKEHDNKYRWLNFLMFGYYWFSLIWGVIISLLDQLTYGHITAYLSNLLVATIIYHCSTKRYIFLHIIPVVGLLAGLFILQKNPEMLNGHIINLIGFLIACVLGARFIYNGYTKMFYQGQQLSATNQQLEQLNENLKQLVISDELTKVANRRGLYEYIQAQVMTEMRRVTVLLLDIDAFKKYNDFYGHLEGDQVLKKIADVLRQQAIEHEHFVARFGGEEFIFVLFDTCEQSALQFAEGVRSAVENKQMEHQASPVAPYVTVSIGMAVNNECTQQEVDYLVRQADEALYVAKEAGRNCVKKYFPGFANI